MWRGVKGAKMGKVKNRKVKEFVSLVQTKLRLLTMAIDGLHDSYGASEDPELKADAWALREGAYEIKDLLDVYKDLSQQ